MRTLLCLLVIATAATQSLLAQVTTLVFTEQYSGPERQQAIPVLAGEMFELLTWRGTGGGVKVDGAFFYVQGSGGSSYTNLTPTGIFVAGPRTVSVLVPSTDSLVCTYKISTVATVATQNVASQAVVIPENASAPVDVIYESSTDLTNWTAAVAGSYAPSTSKRFFRVRLVAH